eukprot:TRINITY_DN1672_c0_g1_i4.p1 TRINITY_DN1672_c0_g1~~TRINITY_DN1672_c0_g1_i4.p1  ORF type:complete len:580 (+),score=39.15 TRINITY_DN1672_c0_g1_i4:102-1841(+)
MFSYTCTTTLKRPCNRASFHISQSPVYVCTSSRTRTISTTKAQQQAYFNNSADSASTSLENTAKQNIQNRLKLLIDDIRSNTKNVEEEVSQWISDCEITGKVPQDLEGSLFRVGPALFERNGVRKNQTFDGDGMICKFSFKDGKIHFMNRFVRTSVYLEEESAGKFLYPGVFSAGNFDDRWFNNPFHLETQNLANTGVLLWAGKLFAMHESGPPYEIDPVTLETIGLSDVFGQVEGKDPFQAHYRIFTESDGSKRWIAFRFGLRGLDAQVTFLEYAQNGILLHKKQYNLPGGALAFCHDMVVTENYYILFENPTKINFQKFFNEYIFNRCCIADIIQFRKDLPGKFHIIPRPGKAGKGLRVINTPAQFIFHHGNAYEVDDGQGIVLDTVSLGEVNLSINQDTFDESLYKSNQRSKLTRFILDLQESKVLQQVSLLPNSCEFPQINWDYTGRPYMYSYIGNAPQYLLPQYWGPNQMVSKVTAHKLQNSNDSLVDSIEISSWYFGDRTLVGEPLFVPRINGNGQEDDGYLLIMTHTPSELKSDLAIMDAQNVKDGPIASINLPIDLPLGLHGSWSETYYGP